MDKNVTWVNEEKIERTIKALEKNNMAGFYVKDKKELLDKIDELVEEGSSVSVGGSMTLFESGIIDHLRSGRFDFKDRYASGLSKEDIKKIYRQAFSCDAYILSANAITESGEIYNVDGTGNRVAAMIYGPDKVIVVVGANKIVKDVDEAVNRIKSCVAPANAKRLNRNTPCAKVGYCMNCSSPERICNEYVLIKKQPVKNRINVIFLNESLGY